MEIITERQIQQEHKAFQKSLDFFQQENALLKYRLSELVDDNEESGFLQLAEYFQNELLLNDERLNQLIKRLHQLREQFSAYKQNSNFSESFQAVQDTFRTDSLEFEKGFLLLSKEFQSENVANQVSLNSTLKATFFRSTLLHNLLPPQSIFHF